MFLASDSGRFWRWASLALALLLTASFLFYGRREDFLHGGSAWGLAYGILATLLILVLLLFGVRKRAYRSTVGKLEGWLQSHVYLGLLTVLVVAFHAGSRYRDGLAVTTFVVMCVVVASGMVGVALYTLVPRLITDLGKAPKVEEISLTLNKLGGRMARLATGKSPAFQKVYKRLMRESAPPLLAGWRVLAGGGRLGRGARDTAALRRALSQVAPDEQEELRKLLQLSRQRREALESLARQQYYRNWLDLWLWLHVPLSVALIVLVAAHVVSALYYGGALDRWDLL